MLRDTLWHFPSPTWFLIQGSGLATRRRSCQMTRTNLPTIPFMLITVFILVEAVSAQSPPPYPHALTDRLIHQETPMLPSPRNVVFTDRDFGSSMIRATDATTNFRIPGSFLRTEGSGAANEWAANTSKFYVISKGQDLVFAFDPATMAVSSLPNAAPGQGLE